MVSLSGVRSFRVSIRLSLFVRHKFHLQITPKIGHTPIILASSLDLELSQIATLETSQSSLSYRNSTVHDISLKKHTGHKTSQNNNKKHYSGKYFLVIYQHYLLLWIGHGYSGLSTFRRLPQYFKFEHTLVSFCNRSSGHGSK